MSGGEGWQLTNKSVIGQGFNTLIPRGSPTAVEGLMLLGYITTAATAETPQL